MAQLKLKFLDSFRVIVAGQPITRFRSAKNQALLAYLALNQERAVPRDVLAALFWPEESESTARKNLRQALYQLRILLGDASKADGDTPHLLVTRQTVQFNGGGDYQLDVNQFLVAVEEGELARAAEIYRGDLLPGFTCDSRSFEEWLRQEQESLHHLALEVMYEATEEHLAQGHFELAQAAARRQLALEPWREPAHRQLMQAYAMAGDRAQAVVQFEQCRETLWAELEVEPAPETIALLDLIKNGRLGPAVDVVRVPPPPKFHHNLPAGTTPLIGRESDLVNISQLLLAEHRRLLTIVGPGGMGKTRLAVAAGAIMLQDFADGVFFVDLAPLNQADDIIPTIASALEYQAPDATAELQPQLLAMLSRRHILLILDNFEHLLGGAQILNDILHRCLTVSLLVTSRQRLNLASETSYELEGLAYPQASSPAKAKSYTAVHLFLESGRRVNSHFDVTDKNVADVIGICQLVQGIPLGLLLASAWLQLLTPAEIAAEIEKSLDFLTADLVDLPPRQRSMEAIFDRSWQMLTPEERAVLARLAVFRGGFTRQAAEQVAAANLRILLSLVNKSLLQRQADSGRFAMHELLRQYAEAKRRQTDPDEPVELAHCRYFTQLMDREARRELYIVPVHVPSQYDADVDNLRQAWTFALQEGLAVELLAMVRGMIAFSFRQSINPASLPQEAAEALRQRGYADDDPQLLRLRLFSIVVRFGYDDDDWVRTELVDFLEQLPALDLPELRYHGYAALAHSFSDWETIVHWDELARHAARQTEDAALIKWSEADHLIAIVWLKLQEEPLIEPLQEMLSYFESHFTGSFAVLNLMGALSSEHLRLGNYTQALAYSTRCLNLGKSWQDLFWISIGADWVADVYNAIDRRDEAALQQLDVLEWHLAIGQVWQTLGFLFAKAAWNRKLIGNLNHIVQILAMVHHHPEATDFHRQKALEESQRLEKEMGATAFHAAWERGKEMNLDSAVGLLRQALANN